MAIEDYGLPVPQNPHPPTGRSRLQDIRSRIARPKRPVPRVRLRPFGPVRPQKPPKPPQKPIPRRWTTNPREVMAMISIFAHRFQKVILRYHKIEDSGDADAGHVVTRMIEPYSVRVRVTKKRGKARYLYGYDLVGNPTIGIHSFLIDRIQSVTGTDQKFEPRYRVEF